MELAQYAGIYSWHCISNPRRESSASAPPGLHSYSNIGVRGVWVGMIPEVLSKFRNHLTVYVCNKISYLERRFELKGHPV